MTAADTDTVLRQIIGGDAAAASHLVSRAGSCDEPLLLVTAALMDPTAPGLLARASELAATTRDRQVVAIAAAHLAGHRDRVDALARDHLVDYPDSILVAWIAAAGPPASASPLRRKESS
jgi:hypothetical protein